MDSDDDFLSVPGPKVKAAIPSLPDAVADLVVQYAATDLADHVCLTVGRVPECECCDKWIPVERWSAHPDTMIPADLTYETFTLRELLNAKDAAVDELSLDLDDKNDVIELENIQLECRTQALAWFQKHRQSFPDGPTVMEEFDASDVAFAGPIGALWMPWY